MHAAETSQDLQPASVALLDGVPTVGAVPPPPPAADFTQQLIQIGNAGAGAGTLTFARQAIVEECAGICASEHVILLLRDPGFPGPLRPQDVVATSGISRQFALAAVEQAWSAVSPDDSTRAFRFSLANHDDYPTAQHVLVRFHPGRRQAGAIVLVRVNGEPFTDQDLANAQLAADQVSMAIARAELEEEVRHRSTERQLVARLTQTVVGMQSLPDVLSEVAGAVRTITGWDACAVAAYARDVDTLSLEAVESGSLHPSGLLLVGERLRLADWHSLRFALDNCSPYQLSLEQPEALGQYEREYLARLGATALLAVPIALNDEAVGLVLLFSRTGGTLDAADLRAVREIGANAALAIQHNQFASLARRQADEQAAMLRISRAIISTKDLHAVLAEICRASLGFEGIEGCRILLWHAEHDRFEIGAVQTVRDWQMYYQVSDQYPSADWPTSRAAIREKVARGYLISDPDLTARERANHDADQIESFHTFPISVGNEVVGVLSLLGRIPRRFSAVNVRIGQELAFQAAQAIDRSRLIGQLRRRAETDGLTGLLNHRAAFETLDRELAAARKLDEQLSIIVIDLDDFKFFNDTHGHVTGDEVLVQVANALHESSRDRDYVARYGGDEFLLILPSTSREMAALVAERMLQRMSTSLQIGALELPIRLSVGVATFPHDARNRQELIAYGDAAMYAAKERGGGQLGTVDRQTRSLEVTPLGALSGLVRAVDRKDRYTKFHSDLVAEYSVRFGRALALSASQIDALDTAGRLHDIGKIAVPDSVLRKPGRLSADEEEMVRQHVSFSELIIKGIPNLELVTEAVANHHERWDGTGYPRKRFGQDIPLLGRILGLSDALAAITQDRPYRKGRSLEQAFAEIRKGAGSQFDPDLVEPFIASVSTATAMLKDESRRHRLNPHNLDPDNPPDVVGLTDYLRLRQERTQWTDERRDTA